MAYKDLNGLIKTNGLIRSMTKEHPKEYEASWKSVLDCLAGIKNEFSWSQDVIAKKLLELDQKV